MATRMPDLGPAMFCASVRYDCIFFALTGQQGRATFSVPNAVEIGFVFQTGSSQADATIDLTTWTWDYSWFDQDTAEAGIRQYLDAICQQIAGLMVTDDATVQGAVRISRVWNFAPVQSGNAAPQQIADMTVIETMAYPPPS